MKTLYTTYDLECKDDGGNSSCTIREFSEILLNVFPNVVRRKERKGEKTANVYCGVELKPLGPLKPVQTGHADLSEIPNFITKQFKFNNMDNETAECECITEFLSNGHEVKKRLLFKNDYTFQVFIGDKQIDLKSLGISPNFYLSSEGVSGVCDIVMKTKLCYGVSVTKETICSRLHTIEQWKNKHSDNATRQLRSYMCNKVVKFNSRSNTCITCQQMTLHVQKKKSSSDKENSDPNPTNPKDYLNNLIPHASEEMLELFMSQINNASKPPSMRRWSKQMITTCLQIYTRSPHVYKMMRDSQLLILPSPVLLVSYKSKIQHDIGFSEQIFRWMHAEACRLKLPEEGWKDGIIMDEMAIQQDIQICKNGDVISLVGMEDVGKEGNTCITLRKGKLERALGTHVLQFMFVGLSGFRFPFGHFTTTNVQAYELYVLFWEAVEFLKMFGFTVVYVSMDGAQSNRTFMNINLGKNSKTMIGTNPSPFDDPIVFIMDPSHMVKKIRNNIIKSGLSKGCTRNLTLPNGDVILWQMWIEAYKWDQCNALKVHKKLTNEHIFPSSQGKMRNHLAPEVLNSEMLHLFEQYQYSLSNGAVLNGATELLKVTSSLIAIFSDNRPILSTEDYRLSDIMKAYKWFIHWEEYFWGDKNKSNKLMSAQCLEDIKSCLIGFYELCNLLLSKKSIHIIPAMINSDIIENHFCQQRSTFNGANSNPTALQYQKNLNSIIISQNLISKKANAGKSSTKSPSLAFTTATKKAKKRSNIHSVSDENFNRIKVIRM